MTAIARQEPFSDYREVDAVHFTRLKRMATSPKKYAAGGPPDEDLPQSLRETLETGRLLHTAVLEPALFETVMCDDEWPGGWSKTENAPSWSKNAQGTSPCGTYKPFKKWRSEQVGRHFEPRARIKIAESVAEAVRTHPAASMYLSWPGTAEVSVYWEHPLGIRMKSRIDWLGDAAILDLKSAADLRPESFAKSCERYHYYAQAALYQDAVKALTGEVRPFSFIAVEKTAPFDVVVYEVPEDSINAGRVQYQDWLLKVKKCRESGEWPGIASKPVELERPLWAYDPLDDSRLFVDGVEI